MKKLLLLLTILFYFNVNSQTIEEKKRTVDMLVNDIVEITDGYIKVSKVEKDNYIVISILPNFYDEELLIVTINTYLKKYSNITTAAWKRDEDYKWLYKLIIIKDQPYTIIYIEKSHFLMVSTSINKIK
jgi:uncharacterized protein YkvS